MFFFLFLYTLECSLVISDYLFCTNSHIICTNVIQNVLNETEREREEENSCQCYPLFLFLPLVAPFYLVLYQWFCFLFLFPCVTSHEQVEIWPAPFNCTMFTHVRVFIRCHWWRLVLELPSQYVKLCGSLRMFEFVTFKISNETGFVAFQLKNSKYHECLCFSLFVLFLENTGKNYFAKNYINFCWSFDG